jgi:hypothetical protein
MKEIADYIKEKESLFVVIGFLVAIISLLPIIITFIFGENWIYPFFSTKSGYLTFLFCLFLTFIIGMFIVYISIWLSHDFYDEKIKNNNSLLKQILLSIFFLIPLSLIILSIFFMSIWSLTNNYLINLPNFSFISAFNIAMLFILIFIFIYIQFFKKISDDKIIRAVLSLILIIGILYVTSPYFSTLITANKGIFDYYNTQPTIELNYSLDYLKENNLKLGPETVSIFIRLNESLPQNNISNIQKSYVHCKWSTNYGHFVVYDKINSILENKGQNFVYNFCNNCSNQIYWTYDYSDVDKSKPDVYILSTIDDKNTNKVLGQEELSFNWTNNTLLLKN